MASSLHRIDIAETLGRYHSELERRQQDEQRSQSTTDVDSPSIDNLFEDNDDISVASSFQVSSGWDETIMDHHAETLSSYQHWQKRGIFLTPHAMALQSCVYGTADDPHGENDEKIQIRWKTSLAPHRVHQIASNKEGTVIAATTDNGAVSILRGRDGKVLATRKLSTVAMVDGEYDKSSSSYLNISFVKTSEDAAHRADALLVRMTESNQPLLLVSNIQGPHLNDPDDTIVAQATQRMNLNSLEIPSIPTNSVLAIEGYYCVSRSESINENNVESSNICFVLIHNLVSEGEEKRLAFAEFDPETETCKVLAKGLRVCSSENDETDSWTIDDVAGLDILPCITAGKTLLATVIYSSRLGPEQSAKMCWIDLDQELRATSDNPDSPVTLIGQLDLKLQEKTAGTQEGKESANTPSARVLAFSFAHSFDAREAIAMTVVLKAGSCCETQMFQARTIDSDVLSLGRFHSLYLIPMSSSIQAINMCPLADDKFGPYSFRWRAFSGWNQAEEIVIFQSSSTKSANDSSYHDGSAIGAIRFLTMSNNYEAARAAVHEFGMESLIQDRFAFFHPVEIALQKMKQSLRFSCAEDETWEESLAAFERGAGSEQGLRTILKAADFVLAWPAALEGSDNAANATPTIGQMAHSLGSFIETMTKLSDIFLDEETPAILIEAYQRKMTLLGEKYETIQYLHDIRKDGKETSSMHLSKKAQVSSDFSSASSANDLFSQFVMKGDFLAAENMWRSPLRLKLSPDSMVASVIQISSKQKPRQFARLLKDVVIPSLSINHEILQSIFIWACRIADEYDDTGEDGMDEAIFFLQCVEKSLRTLRLRVHSSFACYSPFVQHVPTSNTKDQSTKGRRTIDASFGGSSLGESFSSEMSASFCLTNEFTNTTGYRKNQVVESTYGARSNPTILEMGNLKRGPQKIAKYDKMSSLRDSQAGEIDEEAIEVKLEEALWLKEARTLGLNHALVSLRNFRYCGGAEYVCKELIRSFSEQAESHEIRYSMLMSRVRKFAEASRVDYDHALMEYVKDISGGRRASPQTIEEASSVARCCQSPTVKCQITLIALRAALFCRFSPRWLTTLSKDAIDWSAGNSALREELEEASRLLLIDEIIGRYCGNGAKELFHVDNPIHATRLLEFVSIHLSQESVLGDVLDLCEAFHHLSIEDGCARLIQNSILKREESKATKFLKALYLKNQATAHNVFSRVMTFCLDIVDDISGEVGIFPNDLDNAATIQNCKEVKVITACGADLAKIALMHTRMMVASQSGTGFTPASYSVLRLQTLLHDLERLEVLQEEFGIFLRLSDLSRPDVAVRVAAKMVSDIAELYRNGHMKQICTAVTRTRRACSLLASGFERNTFTDAELLHSAAAISAKELAWTTLALEPITFLMDLGVLESVDCKVASRCCIAVALSYCLRASNQSQSQELIYNMKGLVIASSILQDRTLAICTPETLGAATTFADLCDIVCQILTRADEGHGEELLVFRKTLLSKVRKERWYTAQSGETSAVERTQILTQSVLNTSWYVGDGLLLPPHETLRRCIDYCKQCMGLQLMEDPSSGIESFVSNRCALALTERILSHSTMTQISLDECKLPFELLGDYDESLCLALVERYLGGNGTGITSAVVDCQLSLSHLLSLPLKVAFKVYRSSLPTALKMRDFERVVTLATIGKNAGSKDFFDFSTSGKVCSNWSRQPKFIHQCETLATKAKWWKLLDQLGIRFDPDLFDNGAFAKLKGSAEKSDHNDEYAASMILPIIEAMSQACEPTDQIVDLTVRFASDFFLSADLPIKCIVKFLLSPINSELGVDDVRQQLSDLEKITAELLHSLESSKHRMVIIRECLIRIETRKHSMDYERLSIILSLYQNELSSVLSSGLEKEDETMDAYFIEMEAIDRRRDALAILSSYFQGEKKKDRPPFCEFFLPLPPVLGEVIENDHLPKQHCSILGWESQAFIKSHFDPLQPLELTLRSSCCSSVTSALSPLCLPLGVPRGYIRARSLVSRFQRSKKEGAAPPSFEDVLSVLNQLRSQSDMADLAEWCSEQYSLQNSDKLVCLGYALSAAIKASSEVEQQNKTSDDQEESTALLRVKRISAAKDLLEDHLAISNMMQKAIKESDRRTTLSHALQKVEEALEAEVWMDKKAFAPEHFIDFILQKASHVASEATLDEDIALSVPRFRQFSLCIHQICDRISAKYSHVQIGNIARRLTSRWLFHGDEHEVKSDSEISERTKLVSNSQLLSDVDEEDTMNFQMDLSMLKGDSDTTSKAYIGTGQAYHGRQTLSSEEEPSSLKATSAREISEKSSTRCALRIAFVMAFAEGYFCALPTDGELQEQSNDENSENRKESTTDSKRRGLLSKIKASKSRRQNDQHGSLLEHSRELLKMVFAKSFSSDRTNRGLDTSFNALKSNEAAVASFSNLTFAMRHRCLRVASILLPQEALEEALREQNFLSSTDSQALKDCTFGAFFAKELEEMSLPIPHSDLLQLSQMDAPSYSRALWRHHRDRRGSRGRLLLLILELYLKEPVSDFAYFACLIKEIERLSFPRTMMISLECLVRYLNLISPEDVPFFLARIQGDLIPLLTKVLKQIKAEMKRKMGHLIDNAAMDSTGEDRHSAVNTLCRLGGIVSAFSECEQGKKMLPEFCTLLFECIDVVSTLPGQHMQYANVLIDAILKIGPKQAQSALLSQFHGSFLASTSLMVLQDKEELRNDCDLP